MNNPIKNEKPEIPNIGNIMLAGAYAKNFQY